MSLDIYLVSELGMEDDALCYWQGNATHNLNKIAMEIGYYECIWRPDEIGVVKAKDNVENLRTALMLYLKHYEELLELEPSSGWGSLVGLIELTGEYFKACLEYPEAYIEVCR